LPRMRRLVGVGIDYGTTNATAALLVGLGVDGRLYVVDEWRHDPRSGAAQMTDGQLSERIRSWVDAEHLPRQPGLRPEYVTVDPSAASLRVQLYRDGLATTPADNDVGRGLGVLATLLAERRLLVSESCRGLLAEVPGYSWDDKATQKGEDKPVKVADHSIDGLRYGVVTTEALWRPHLV